MMFRNCLVPRTESRKTYMVRMLQKPKTVRANRPER